MSWFRGIISLYILTFTIFYSTVWAIISNMVFQTHSGFVILLITLSANYLMQFLGSRGASKALIFGGPVAIAGILIELFYGSTAELINLVLVVGTMLIYTRINENTVNYKTYAASVKNGIFILAGLGLFLINADPEFRTELLKFYILFLSTAVWLLRESRRYTYNLTGKRSLLKDSAAVAAVFLLSSTKIFSFIFLLIKGLWSVVEYVLTWLLTLVIRILDKPMEMFFKWIIELIQRRGGSVDIKNQGNQPEELQKLTEEAVSRIPGIISTTFKILLLVAAIIIIYKVIKNYRFPQEKEQESVKEERETIAREKGGRKRPIVTSLKDLIFGIDPRSQVLRLYQNFQKKSYEKHLYKRHMTATQLYNVTRVNIEDASPIKSITEIYNESKFSEHEVTENIVKQAKEDARNIRKQM